MKTAYLLLILLAALPASAGTFYGSTCPTDTLANYVTNYGSVQGVSDPNAPIPSGGQPYFDGCQGNPGIAYGGFYFASSVTGTNGSTVLPDSDITLTPDGTGFSLSFSTAPTANSGDEVQYMIGYTIIDPPPIVGGDLSIDPTGDVTLSVQSCNNTSYNDNTPNGGYGNAFLGYINPTNSFFVACGNPPNSDASPTPLTAPLITLSNLTGALNGSYTFPGGPWYEVGVLFTLTLNGDDGTASLNGTITADPTTSSSTPEPGSLWLLAPVLIGLAAFTLRFRRQRA